MSLSKLIAEMIEKDESLRKAQFSGAFVVQFMQLHEKLLESDFAWHQRLTTLCVALFSVFAAVVEVGDYPNSAIVFIVALVAWTIAIILGVFVTFEEVSLAAARRDTYLRDAYELAKAQQFSGRPRAASNSPTDLHKKVRIAFYIAFGLALLLFLVHVGLSAYLPAASLSQSPAEPYTSVFGSGPTDW